MAKPPKKGDETIIPPAEKAVKDGSKQLKKGSPSGGRAMADASVAKRQGVTRDKPKNSK